MSTDLISLPCVFHNQLYQKQIKPKSIKTMIMKKSSKTCPICIQGFKQDQLIKKLPCSHIFHRGCIKEWLKKSTQCPLCRCDVSE